MRERIVSGQYLSPERDDTGIVRKQSGLFAANELLISTLDSISTAVLILNGNRQIVFANRAFLTMISVKDSNSIMGLRPGEAIGCIYSDRNEGGCGTSDFCRECGAARAILSSLDGKEDIQDCSIALKDDPNALDLRVKTTPMELGGEVFTVFSITDIGDQKRREVLERIFLHDVRNTAGGIQGFSQLLTEEEEDARLHAGTIADLSVMLLDEIDSYNQLTRAENRQLIIRPVSFSSKGLLERTVELYFRHDAARDREIRIDPRSEDLELYTDETILSRVIGNMTKNALEAIAPGEVVTLCCSREGEMARFEVHNPGMIPSDASLQIFQRSFSTKGPGRGLGTYSIRLLSEHYLKGKVGFTTSGTGGTTFFGIFPLAIAEH